MVSTVRLSSIVSDQDVGGSFHPVLGQMPQKNTGILISKEDGSIPSRFRKSEIVQTLPESRHPPPVIRLFGNEGRAKGGTAFEADHTTSDFFLLLRSGAVFLSEVIDP